MSNYRTFLASWRRDEQGVFAVYAAIAFPILFAIVGFGLDYWATLSTKARLDAAVDTSAIAAVRAATNYVQTNPSSLSGTALTNAAIAAGQGAAIAAFNANGGNSVALTSVTPTISVTYANRTFTATVAYSTTRPTGFAGLVGVNSLGLGGTATATQKQLTYMNVYVLVDTSQSMGIAANQAQMTALYNASAPYNYDGNNIGCVFGCHVPGSGQTVSMETIAHNNNVNLRIDVARAAIYNMAQTAKVNAINGNINISVYAMQQTPDTSPQQYLSQVYPYSGCTANNYACMSTAFAANNYSVLDLGHNDQCCGWGDTDLRDSITTFVANLPAQGDGSSASSPLNYVYVITDGMLDSPTQSVAPSSPCTWSHCTAAAPSSICDPIKSKGATVGVIYTTYIPIYAQNNPSNGYDGRYSALAQQSVPFIAGNLSSCSSGSGWFYQATDDTALLNAMQNLFASTMSQAELTN